MALKLNFSVDGRSCKSSEASIADTASISEGRVDRILRDVIAEVD